MHRFRCALAVLFMTFVVMALAPAHAGAATPGDEADFLSRINSLRAGVGVAPLELDTDLTGVAEGWTQTMAANGAISHNPSLSSELTANRTKLGENVGMGPSVASVFDAFVNSPHHYANLVDPAFNKVGVAVVWSGSTLYTTHDFVAYRGGTTVRPSVVTAPPTTAAPRPVTTRPPVAVTVPKTTTTAPPTTTTTEAPAPPVTEVASPPAVKAAHQRAVPVRQLPFVAVVVAVFALATGSAMAAAARWR
jgi:hypothetical protein